MRRQFQLLLTSLLVSAAVWLAVPGAATAAPATPGWHMYEGCVSFWVYAATDTTLSGRKVPGYLRYYLTPALVLCPPD